MIYNMRRRKKKVSLKWYFNPEPSITRNHVYNAYFTSNGAGFTGIETLIYPGILYRGNRQINAYSTDLRRWSNRAYRTVTFDEPPTGELLTFLQANATPL